MKALTLRRPTFPAVRVVFLVECDYCFLRHEATYHHEGRWSEGSLYEVTCTDGLTDYYTSDRLVTVVKTRRPW